MPQFKYLPILAAVAALAVSATFGSQRAAATIYDITSCEIVGVTCPTGGTINVTDITGGVDVLVTLASNEVFAQTGAGGGSAVLFDLAGDPTITVTTVTANLINPTSTDTFTVTNGGAVSNPLIHADGTGHWGYGVQCTSCGSGTSSPILVSPIEFKLFGTGLTSGSFEQNDNMLLFALDVGVCSGSGVCGSSGNPITATGLVDVVPAPPIGQGLGVLLAVGGLLLGVKLWERSSKNRNLFGTAAA